MCKQSDITNYDISLVVISPTGKFGGTKIYDFIVLIQDRS